MMEPARGDEPWIPAGPAAERDGRRSICSFVDKRRRPIGAESCEEVIDNVLLPSLSEGESVHRERIAQSLQAINFAAERQS